MAQVAELDCLVNLIKEMIVVENHLRLSRGLINVKTLSIPMNGKRNVSL
jgi:hypothetical protein